MLPLDRLRFYLEGFKPQSEVRSNMEEGIHRPWRSEPDIIEGPKRLNLELWVLELEARGGFDERSQALVSL